jgi:hypothetical protein
MIFWLENVQLLYDLSITEIPAGESNYFLPGGKPLKNQEAVRIFKKMEVVSRSNFRA